MPLNKRKVYKFSFQKHEVRVRNPSVDLHFKVNIDLSSTKFGMFV